MFFVIQQNNGEEYEDYFKWNERVYEIDTTKEKMLSDWELFMKEKFSEVGIVISHVYFHSFYVDQQHMEEEKSLYERPKMKKTIQRKYNKVLKENIFINWLELTYNIRPISFEEIGI